MVIEQKSKMMQWKSSSRSNSNVGPEYNLALLGALSVGKSALTVKYITKRYIMEYDPCLEDTYTKQDTIDNQDVTLKIMDTYDKEGSSPDRYLKWADGFIIVYSITNRQSYDMARTYLESVTQYQRITGKEKSVALVGNKMDLERYRTVSKQEGKALATQYESYFFETSAAEDFDCVAKVFHSLVKEISRINERQMPLQPLFISEDRSISSSNSRTTSSIRRQKSPKTGDTKEAKVSTRNPSKSSFRIGLRSFKIFQ